MYNHFKEAVLPDAYRRREADCILSALAMQRSVQVVGLAGMGTSNLLRFLLSHPHLLQDRANFAPAEVCFLFVDCNKLSPVSALNFFRECLLRLQPEADLLALNDEFLLYKRLEAALRDLDGDTFVVLAVDRFQGLYEGVRASFFGQLRNLRDEARGGRMAFILGSQRPPGDFRELERLISHTCLVGPLAETDQAEFFARHEARLQAQVPPAWRDRLWRLTGGHPGLLKNGVEWYKQKNSPPPEDDAPSLIADLLSYGPVEKHCLALWESLNQAEQDLLWVVAEGGAAAGEVADRLRENGLLIDAVDEPALFSPLWQTYLRQSVWSGQRSESIKIMTNSFTRQVALGWRGNRVDTTLSRPLVFALFQALAEAQGEFCSKEDLLHTLYPEDKTYEVTEDSLFQLISSLRREIDPLVKNLYPAMASSFVQNVRSVGYRLVVELPGAGQMMNGER
jgi:hypothetical protein